MDVETTSPTTSPERTDVPPDTFAMHVTDEQIGVWQYCVTVSSPDGEWNAVETLALGDEPRLSLEYAKLVAPTDDGYWMYSREYSCELDCE
jgi:hypothetical protein